MKRLWTQFTMVVLLSASAAMAQIPQTISYQGVLTDTEGSAVPGGDYSILFNLYNVSSAGSPLWTETQTVTINDGVFNVILGSVNPINIPFDESYWLGIAIDSGSELSPRIEMTSSAYSLKARSVADSSVTAASIAEGQIVRSINTLKDDITVSGGDNISVSQEGNTLTISATGVGDGDITGVVAGGGLTGGGTGGDVTLTVTPGVGIQVQPDEVRLDEGYVDARFVNEAQANSVTSAMITDGSVGAAELANNSVTEVKIANNAVTAAKINPNIVSSVEGVISDGGNIDLMAGPNISISADDGANTITIAATGVGTGDITSVIAGNGLTGGGTTGDVTLDVAAGTGISVDANSISLDETYTDGRFVNEAQSNSVSSAMITDGAVGSADLANNAVTEVKIANDAVTAAKINPNIVSSVAGVINDGGNIDLVAGSNITITPDDANDQITFSATASNLWSQNGSDLYYISGNVGIGAVTVPYPLTMFPASNTRGISISHTQNNPNETSSINVFLNKTASDNTAAYGMFSQAINNAGTGPAYAVYGYANGNSSGIKTGVRGYASGTGTHYGIYGHADGDDGTQYGVYGHATGDGTLWAGYFTGNVYAGDRLGVGTTSPAAELQVGGTDGVLFTGTYESGTIPVEGAGTRMMWYPAKAAFRAGYVTGTQWDDANIGGYSVALGYGSTASNLYSTAMGAASTASGHASTAMGRSADATGTGSVALGDYTEANGSASTAMGRSTTANGGYSTAMGSYVGVAGTGSFAIGDYSVTASPMFTTDNRFYARFANGFRLYTNTGYSAGVFMDAGDNSWRSMSDSTKKENLKDVDGEDFLNKISCFNLTSWNYIGQDPSQFRHYGPMAQDFYAAFGNDGIGTIGNDTTLSSADFDGINFIAIQALEKRTTVLRDKTAEIEKLRKDFLALKQENNTLKQKLVSMESGLKNLKVLFTNYQNQQTDNKITLTNNK